MMPQRLVNRLFKPYTNADEPIAIRIQRAAFALTMLVVLAIGSASLGLQYWEIPHKTSSTHAGILRLVGTHLEADIGNALGDIQELSRSSLVWTALTDTSGREAYLKPFLDGRDSAGHESLLLVDYKGRLVAGQVRANVPKEDLSRAIETVLTSREPRLIVSPKSAVLLAAYPVLFPYGQEPIGVLLGSVDLNNKFQQIAASLDQGYGIQLRADNALVSQHPAESTARHYPVRQQLHLSTGKTMPALELELYSFSHAWLASYLRQCMLYLGVGVLLGLLVWQVARRMAVSLTRRLDRLAAASAEVKAGVPFVMPDDPGRDEIGMLAQTLRDALQAHEQIRAQLTTLVEERTRELNESLERYQQAFEINTAIKLMVDPVDGRILDVNRAACVYYGYTRDKLLSMRISDINVLPESEIHAEMERALVENRLYFNFRHRLAAGAVRDVEVYSGPITIAGHQYLHTIVHDVTERKRAEAALRQTEEKYRYVVDNIKEVVFQTDTEGHWTFLNPAWEEITGFTVEETLAQPCLNYVHFDDRERLQKLFTSLIERQVEYCCTEIRYLHHDGGFRWIEAFAQLTLGADGSATGTTGTLMDVTERHDAAERLRLAASVFQHSHEGILLTDNRARIINVNDAFSRITGYSREEALGLDPSFLKSGHQDAEFYGRMWTELKATGYWQGEVWNRRKTGEVYPELLTISAVRDPAGGISHYVGVFADISPLKLHEQQLEQIAHYDALTQLPNRLLLADRMRLALAHAKRSGKRVGVCYLDLDGFKVVNDSHGHAAGDQLLIEVAARLAHTVREGDTVARLAGDEFVLLLLGLNAAEACEEVLHRVLSEIAEPFFINGTMISVTGSIGVAIYPDTDEDADALLRQADQAMYLAKQTGKSRYQLFNSEQDQLLRQRREQILDLERAVEQNELTLYYQPKLNLKTGVIVGVEALLRWQHPTLGLLLPGAFLTDLNNAELECRIGQWVMETALRQLDAWSRQGLHLSVAVNVSAPYLERPDFIPRLRELFEAHPDCPRQLEIEVLESAALGDIDRVAEIIQECREFGVNFALDDFGTGYSSLTYFRRLPASILKIDMSFVRNMLDDPDDFAIVKGIIGLAQAFGRAVVAEGVETEDHCRVLLELGCEVAQGFGIARPMPADDICGWLARRQTALQVQ